MYSFRDNLTVKDLNELEADGWDIAHVVASRSPVAPHQPAFFSVLLHKKTASRELIEQAQRLTEEHLRALENSNPSPLPPVRDEHDPEIDLG